MFKRWLLILLFTAIAPVTAQDSASFLPDDLQSITTDNADQLQQVAQIGYGLITDIDWSPDGQTAAVGTSLGVIVYDANAFEYAPHTWLPLPDEAPFYYHGVGFSPDGRWLATASTSFPLEN